MNSTSETAALGESGHIAIPQHWRVGQAILCVLVVLLGIYFYTLGWHSPAGETHLADNVSLFDAVGLLVLIGFIWLTTPAAATLAWATFQESVRRKWMFALLIFAVVLLVISTFFTWMQPGSQEKFILDFGLGFIVIITMLMAIFLGVALVPPEIERRTILTILSKPVDRAQFLIGKFLGLCLTLLVNLAILSIMFLLTYALFRFRLDQGVKEAMMTYPGHPGLMFELGSLTTALSLQYGFLIIMAALALMLSLLLSNIAAIVVSFIVYFGGQTSGYWEYLSQGKTENAVDKGLAPAVRDTIHAIYFVLPRFDRFDVRERIVNHMPIGFNYMFKSFSSGLVYAAVLLIISYLLFSDREF
jgi:ABC-type transport system involved in multi-copper enzyme maturation permease subunit